MVDSEKTAHPGCGTRTAFWVARYKYNHANIEFGTAMNSELCCGQYDEYLNHRSWDFLCQSCAKKAGWLW